MPIGKIWRDEDGATSIEYALIATLISIVIVAGATSIGEDVKAKLLEVLAGFV